MLLRGPGSLRAPSRHCTISAATLERSFADCGLKEPDVHELRAFGLLTRPLEHPWLNIDGDYASVRPNGLGEGNGELAWATANVKHAHAGGHI